MMPVLQLGPLAIPFPALLTILGIWLGLSLAERHAHLFNVNPDQIFNLALIAMVAGVIAARLTYFARFPSAFSQNPLDIFTRNPGLLDPFGGFVFGALAAAIYARRKGMQIWSTLDAITPALAVLLLAIGFAHLASGEAYGAPTSLPWGLSWLGARRHPTQIYEILGALCILYVLWPGRRAYTNSGIYFLNLVLAGSSLRLFLEAFRGDSLTTFMGLRVPQLIAWGLLAAGFWLTTKRVNPTEDLPEIP